MDLMSISIERLYLLSQGRNSLSNFLRLCSISKRKYYLTMLDYTC